MVADRPLETGTLRHPYGTDYIRKAVGDVDSGGQFN